MAIPIVALVGDVSYVFGLWLTHRNQRHALFVGCIIHICMSACVPAQSDPSMQAYPTANADEVDHDLEI
jgi:hypothetical protein